jgi:inner membrane component-like transport protein
VLAGVWMAIGYAVAALIVFILIITIPFGVAALRIGSSRPETARAANAGASVGSSLPVCFTERHQGKEVVRT